MNKIQEHQLQLLTEIDELCIENSIPYVLYGRTARDACLKGSFIGDYMWASILMPIDFFDRFTECMKKKYGDHRAVERMTDNPSFSGVHMRYVDEDTVFIYGDSAYKYQHLGIYVTIEAARYIPKNSINAKLSNLLDYMLSYLGSADLSGLNRSKKLAVYAAKCLKKVFGWKKTVQWMLKKQIALSAKKSKNLAILRYHKSYLEIPSDYLTATKRVRFETAKFPVPSKSDSYLTKAYGSTWKKGAKASSSATHLLACSADVSYKDIITAEEAKELKKTESIIAERTRLQAEMTPLQKKIESYWDVLFLTKDRVDMFRKYYPRREYLKKLINEKKYVELEAAAQPLMQLVNIYLDKGLSLSVSADIDAVIAFLLRYSGKYADSDRFLAGGKKLRPMSDAFLRTSDFENDDSFFPSFINVCPDKRVATFCRSDDDREFSLVYRNYGDHRIYNMLGFAEGVLCPATTQDETALIACCGDEEYDMVEFFEQYASASPYVELCGFDTLGRRISFGVFDKDFHFCQTAVIEDGRYIGTVEPSGMFLVEEENAVLLK